jgi:hypothetical protein
VITSLPYSITEDTTQATTDSQDAAVNQSCGETDASVWFKLTPVTSGVLFVDVAQTNYSAGILIATGQPGELTHLTCGRNHAWIQASAGQTYYIMPFDDQLDEAGNGGQLAMYVDVITAAPTINRLTTDGLGRFDPRAGSATLSGIVNCSGQRDLFGPPSVGADLSQQLGSANVTGWGSTDVVCDGADHRWQVTVTPSNGKFVGGPAEADVTASARNLVGRASLELPNESVKLRG